MPTQSQGLNGRKVYVHGVFYGCGNVEEEARRRLLARVQVKGVMYK